MVEPDHQLAGDIDGTVSAALDLVPFAMLIADRSARVIETNYRWTDMSSLDLPASLGLGWLDGVSPDGRLQLHAAAQRVANEGGTETCDYQLIGGSGPRWCRWWLSRHIRRGKSVVVIAAADVEDDYVRQASLYHLATHDSLTGLANRSHFMDSIEQALLRNQRQARRVGVVYVDLDGFKLVNDQGGHSLGDRVLLAMSARLRHAVRAADTAARIGGDEFAVLCEGLDAIEQAEVVARRIELALAEAVELDGERWLVSASVGAAVDRGTPDSADMLMDRADRAMYCAKQARRGPVTPPEDATAPDGAAVSEAVTRSERVSQPERRARAESAEGATGPERATAPESDLRASLASIRAMLDRLIGPEEPERRVVDVRAERVQERRG